MTATKFFSEILVALAALAVLIFCWVPARVAHASEGHSVPFISMEDFFRNPETSSWSISPDGTKLAFMRPWERRMNVYVRDIATGEETRVTSATERNVAGFFWKGSDRIAYAQDKGGDENFHVWIVDIKTLAARDLIPFEGVRSGVLDDLEDDPEHMLIEMNLHNREVFEVFRCTLAKPDSDREQKSFSSDESAAITPEQLAELGLVQIAENPGDITGWMTDHDGRLRIAERTDGVNTTLLYRTTEDQDFRELITTDFHDSFAPVLFTYDNKKLYVASNLSRDKEALYEFDPEANRTGDLIFENPEVDVASLLHSKKRKKITAAIYVTDKRHYHFFDDERKELQETLEALFPDYQVSVADMDDDETRCIVRTSSDRTRGAYYFYDRASKDIKKLDEISPWLDEKNMSPMTPIEFQSRDGLTIHGYLTVPAGLEAKNLPLVVIPHGGPSARDYWGFDSEAQFLANRGAAVLQVNFRGSTGYGKGFWTAGFKKWGLEMQHDVTDGVEWAVKQGIADPKRLAIYGGSYGGYAALAGATFTPDLYACAVSYVGPSNIFTLLETIPPYWKPLIDMEYEMIGDPVKDKELLTAISPVFHADQIKIPLLVAQGANDPRVNKAESDQIVEAVRKRGQDVVYMVKDNEGHGFHNEENRFDFYRAMESFFQKHLGLRTQ